MVLNQDTAREFLTSKDDVERYKFFMSGTLFEQISADLTLTLDKLTETKSTLDTKRKDLEDMKNIVKALVYKVREYEQLDQLQGHLDTLKKMLAWSVVEEKEREVAKVEEDMEKAKKKLIPIDKQIQDTDVSFFFFSFLLSYYFLFIIFQFYFSNFIFLFFFFIHFFPLIE